MELRAFHEAEKRDRLGYLRGLKGTKFIPDRSKWHAAYNADRDIIVFEEKFSKLSPEEKVQVILHEGGHRGQKIDASTYAAFKKRHLNKLPFFLDIANKVHLEDFEERGKVDGLASEAFAESYSRFALGREMPEELRKFWRLRAGGARKPVVGDAKGKEITLKAIRPNVGIAAAYRRKLLALVNEMATSYQHWIKAQYRRSPPEMAQDESPAQELQREIRKLGRRWEKKIDALAPQLARWFAKSAGSRSEAALKKMLRDAGFTVKFQMTPAMRDVIEATVIENVSLIKSIASTYHSQVEGLVMRSVTVGGDLAQLSKDLQNRYGVTRRRAERIALDQNRKATAVLRRARETELGIEEGIWLHSGGGNEPRPTHLHQNGKRFNLKTGWYDPDPKVRKHILPGELINCRCVWKPVIRGFS